MNVNHLKAFHCVAKHLSFSRAAEELFSSQSSVSIQVKKLEESLGIKLFEQLGKRIYLTEAGSSLFSYAQKIFATIDEAIEVIQEIKGFGRGRLLIGASTTPGVYLLPKIIGNFKGMYPGVVPRLEIANSRSIGDMVCKNMLDFGIVGGEMSYPAELIVDPWIKDELFLVVPQGHPLAEKKAVHLEDLTREEFIFREPGSSTRSIVENILSKQQFTARIVMELNNTEAVKQAVRAGLGVSIISEFSVADNPEITCVPIQNLHFFRMLNIVYHRDKIFSPSTERFISFLKSTSK